MSSLTLEREKRKALLIFADFLIEKLSVKIKFPENLSNNGFDISNRYLENYTFVSQTVYMKKVAHFPQRKAREVRQLAETGLAHY